LIAVVSDIGTTPSSFFHGMHNMHNYKSYVAISVEMQM